MNTPSWAARLPSPFSEAGRAKLRRFARSTNLLRGRRRAMAVESLATGIEHALRRDQVIDGVRSAPGEVRIEASWNWARTYGLTDEDESELLARVIGQLRGAPGKTGIWDRRGLVGGWRTLFDLKVRDAFGPNAGSGLRIHVRYPASPNDATVVRMGATPESSPAARTAPTMSATLRIIRSGRRPEERKLRDGAVLTLGRDASNDIELPGDAGVSRKLATLELTPKGLKVAVLPAARSTVSVDTGIDQPPLGPGEAACVLLGGAVRVGPHVIELTSLAIEGER